MRWLQSIILLALLAGCRGTPEQAASSAQQRWQDEADRLAHEILILDGHVDLPFRLYRSFEDVSVGTDSGHFDYPRARQGGLDAPFMSIYVPSSYEGKPEAKQVADEQIAIVERLVSEHPDKFALATSADEIEAAFAAGKIALPMGMENGAAILGDLENLRSFFERGIRYLGLTHDKDNHLGDSSFDERHTWSGLSPFG
ncbi:MAG: membrane dipeptidase, partial [Acidobacteriota bacterium]